MGNVLKILNPFQSSNQIPIYLPTQLPIHSQTYRTHDNGGRPFKVIIDNNVKVYKDSFDDAHDDVVYEKHPFLSVDSTHVFVGKSPLIEMTKFSGGHGPKFDGNSMLVHLKNNEYIFIGIEIFSFNALGKIINYVSLVGNNDVVYPYCIDEYENIYLMIENVIIKMNDKIKQQMVKYDNPYDYYYDYHIITKNRAIPPNSPKILNFNNIRTFHIGDETYTMTYHPDPGEDYDRFIDRMGSPVYVVDYNHIKHILSKPDYVKLINKFGKLNSFEPFQKGYIYSKRLY